MKETGIRCVLETLFTEGFAVHETAEVATDVAIASAVSLASEWHRRGAG